MTARTKEALCCDFRAHDFVGRWVSLSFLSQKLVVFLPKHSILRVVLRYACRL